MCVICGCDMSRVETFMRVTYPHIFEIRLKSIEFNEKHMYLEILTIFYLHIIRILFAYFIIFVLFAYYSHILQVYLQLSFCC